MVVWLVAFNCGPTLSLLASRDTETDAKLQNIKRTTYGLLEYSYSMGGTCDELDIQFKQIMSGKSNSNASMNMSCDDEEFVSCQICFMNFDETERVPKYLEKCYHYFCLPCLGTKLTIWQKESSLSCLQVVETQTKASETQVEQLWSTECNSSVSVACQLSKHKTLTTLKHTSEFSHRNATNNILIAQVESLKSSEEFSILMEEDMVKTLKTIDELRVKFSSRTEDVKATESKFFMS
ncbi:hypothetical protein DAPPUDRAFT_337579 [Daphnia pulex]|uniref:RING-type domain-containing protein n=1 Tax=Daphnia pulex TaxID=6669 RepID=E9I1U6_DAPPU|nr:hypothetical protein DAPPUDRAFT_337579 [Daphnia pulex]|eukprot:EFX62035.1 hypothetical protein DAPPUDRAFT_337579 [Daphnia pulex]